MDVSFGEFTRGLADGVIVRCFATAHLSLLKMATLKKSWERNEMNCEVSLNFTSKLQLSMKNFATVFSQSPIERMPDLSTNTGGEACNFSTCSLALVAVALLMNCVLFPHLNHNLNPS